MALRRIAGEGGSLALFGLLKCPDERADPWIPELVDQRNNRVVLELTDQASQVKSVFQRYDGRRITLYGPVYRLRSTWYIHQPEPISYRRAGMPRPIYPLHHMTRQAMARQYLDELEGSYLEAAKLNNEFIRQVRSEESFARYLAASVKELLDNGLKDAVSRSVALGVRDARPARAELRTLLSRIHFPESDEQLRDTIRLVERTAAVVARASEVREAVKARQRHQKLKASSEVFRPDPRFASREALIELAADFPFNPTDEQFDVVAEIVADMMHGPRMRRVLSGDVGTGKTVIYALTAAVVVASGGTVGLMAPRQLLAKQNHAKLSAWLPNISIGLATGEGAEGEDDAPLWIGTQAISSVRPSYDAVLIDEQQLFSVDQRETPAGMYGHLLEGTATCIPRTTALTHSGEWGVSRLRKTHVDKRFEHRLLMPDQRGWLIEDLGRAVEKGQTMIVVYPRLDVGAKLKSGKTAPALRESIEVWERLFPGKVSYCHGGDKAQQRANDEAIEAIHAGRSQILVGTAILEVGIDIPSVERITVIQPDLFGLSQLHQLRGRVARAGGTGYCDLLLLENPSKKVRKRMNYFVETTDGFVLAERDLLIRGGGDATAEGHVQSGKAPKSPFENHELSSDILPAVTAELEAAYWAEFESNTDMVTASL